jgi:hypothetical protein
MSPPPTCMFQFTTINLSEGAEVGADDAASTTGGPTLRRQLCSDARSPIIFGPTHDTPGVVVSLTGTSRPAIEWPPAQPLSTPQLSASDSSKARREFGNIRGVAPGDLSLYQPPSGTSTTSGVRLRPLAAVVHPMLPTSAGAGARERMR